MTHERVTVRIADPLVGWQEIDEADAAAEHDILAEVFRRLPSGLRAGAEHEALARTFGRGYDHVGFGTACPISVPPGLVVRRWQVTQTCEGRRKVTPHRVCVQALIDVPGLRDWPGFVDLNGHLPYRAPDLWLIAHRKWRSIAQGWRDGGWTQLTQRDTNKHGHMPLLDVTERQLIPGETIDKVSTIEGRLGRRLHVDVLDRKRVNLTIDGHDARGVLVRLTQPTTGDQLVLWVVTANIGRKVSQREARANIALVRRGFRVKR